MDKVGLQVIIDLFHQNPLMASAIVFILILYIIIPRD